MELSGTAPFGAQASLAAQMPARTPPEVPVVDESRDTRHTQGDSSSTNRDSNNAQATRDLVAARRDPEVQTGPPPTFEVTLLEVEQDLQATLARLEAARNHDRDAEAVRADAPEPRSAPLSEPTPEAEPAPPPAPAISEMPAQDPAERVAVAQLDQPYDVPAAPDRLSG